MEKTAKNALIVKSIIFLISFGIAFFAARYFFSKTDKTDNLMLVENSRTANKSLPKMLDSETQLDSTSVENMTLKYHHTLIHTVKDSSDFDVITIKSAMSKKAQDNFDNNPVMKDYRENGISLQYIFNDKRGNEILEYTVTHQK